MKLIYTGYTTDSNTVLSFKKRQAKQLCVYGSGETTNYTSGGTFEDSICKIMLSTGETKWEIPSMVWDDFSEASGYTANTYSDDDTYEYGDDGSGGGTDASWTDKGNIIPFIPVKEFCEINTDFTNCNWNGITLRVINGFTFTGVLAPDEGYKFNEDLSLYGITCIGKSGNITVYINNNGYATIKIENVQEDLTISCTCIASS